MLRARSYARYSSTNQREESIEGQLRASKEYAMRQDDMQITGEYTDRALSGKNAEKRTQFQRMIRDAERGLFDVLLVYKLDRFARNRYDAALYKAKLKKAGVKVISIMESIPEGAEGIILESVLDGFAEYYSENLAENVRRGAKDTALAAKFNGGQTPYGYRVIDGRLEVDEARAMVVKEVFERYVAGETYNVIFNSLNDRGLRTLKGKAFSRGSVASMLQNEKYIGDFVYNVSSKDSVKIAGGCPSIISPELWAAAQKRRAAASGSPRRGKGAQVYILSGKIICGICGETFHGISTVADGKIYTYYRHNRPDNVKCTCENRFMMHRDDFDNKVFVAIRDNILNPITIQEIAAQAVALQEEGAGHADEATRAELSEVKTAISNIYKAIEAGVFSDGLNARLASLEGRAADLAESIVASVPPDDLLTKEQIESYLSQFMLGDINDVDFRRSVMSTFIKRIELEKDGTARIFLHYTAYDELETISFVFNNQGLAQVLKPINPQDAGIVLFT